MCEQASRSSSEAIKGSCGAVKAKYKNRGMLDLSLA